MSEVGAILLAGGRGSRMGGVRKPLLQVGGQTLLAAAIGAVRDAGCDQIIVVGDPPVERGRTAAAAPLADVSWVREDPPFGGPAAAILAALPLVEASRTFVLACDLPRVAAAVRLLRETPFTGDGLCLADASGRPQWLTGLYRTQSLRAAGAALPRQGQDASARSLLGDLSIVVVAAPYDVTADIDTWDDLNEARRRSP